MACTMCGGEPMYLGEMGRSFTALRCRACGWEWLMVTPECFVPTEEAEEEAEELRRGC